MRYRPILLKLLSAIIVFGTWEIAGRIPVKSLAGIAQMEILSGQRKWEAIVEQFGQVGTRSRTVGNGGDLNAAVGTHAENAGLGEAAVSLVRA